MSAAFSRRPHSRRPRGTHRLSRAETPRSRRAVLEVLEDRYAPAIFAPLAATADGAAGSLRADILTANGNGDALNTFNLDGGTYNLTIANTGGAQENAGLEGDLDIDNLNGGVPVKTYVFNGNGATIDAGDLDRVVHILSSLGSAVVVQFVNLTLQNGTAIDKGTLGATVGDEDAHGGGVLNDGGDVSFTSSTVRDNVALGFDGGNGANGAGTTGGGAGDPANDGVNGRAARGGGLYSVSGAITLNPFTSIQSNNALGGDGGNGGNGASAGNPAGRGGDGGDGSVAEGGGVYLAAGDLGVNNASFSNNRAVGGQGGEGGTGGVGADIGGNGGRGGAGGDAHGGGIANLDGNVTIDSGSQVQSNGATGGAGSNGGHGGFNTGGIGRGGNGGTGGAGGSAQGGGVWASAGNVLIDNLSSLADNRAAGGAGGNAGDGRGGTAGGGTTGGNGGAGGSGGNAQGGALWANEGSVTVDHGSAVTTNHATAGTAGDGGNGGNVTTNAGAGGAGGAGGAARGGGLWANLGIVTIDESSRANSNTATGGEGGAGGNSGTGFNKNAGGQGGYGGEAFASGIFADANEVRVFAGSTVNSNQSQGGKGGVGGTGDTANAYGGDGGAAIGGVYAVSGAISVAGGSTINSNQATGGAGGVGGAGLPGIAGSRGGNGGAAQGGGLLAAGLGAVLIDASTISGNSVTAGSGGGGGQGGNGPTGGAGGQGQAGGYAQGAGVYSSSNVTVTNGSLITNNLAFGGHGGTGGSGGTGTAGAGGAGGTGGGGNVGGGAGMANFGAPVVVLIDFGSRVEGNEATGGNGGNGGRGGDGTTQGGAGGGGNSGSTAVGGGVWVSDQVIIDHGSSVSGNSVRGGQGGSGGAGGNGPLGGNGGAGAPGGLAQGGGVNNSFGGITVLSSTIDNNSLAAGAGGDGGNGGLGTAGADGAGGNGGDGGAAEGAGLWADNGSDILIDPSSVSGNQAKAGNGGVGGSTVEADGVGGNGGAGGNIAGVGVWFSANTLMVESSTIAGNQALLGAAGGPGGLSGGSLAGVFGQWADSVIDFSTEYTPSPGNWSAFQATGAPNTFAYGDITTAWASENYEGTLEYLTLGFATPVYASGVVIRETDGNGFVYRVDVLDTSDVLHTVFSGVDPSLPGSPVDFLVTFPPTPFLVKGVKVYVDTDHDPSEWEEIDAVELQGSTTPPTGSGTGGDGGNGGNVLGVGVFADASVTSTVITNSTLSANIALGGGNGGAGGGGGGVGGGGGSVQGGGAYLDGTTATIINSTISGNTLGPGGSSAFTGVSQGGGLFLGSTSTLRNVTIASNTAVDEGGGLRNEGSLSLFNTILADNTSTGTSEGDFSDVGVFGATPQNNLVEDADGHTLTNGPNGNIVGVDPQLGPLANNGGPTQTHAITFLSPAFIAGNDAQALDADGFPQLFDQRGPGFDRSAPTDIGAFEVQAPPFGGAGIFNGVLIVFGTNGKDHIDVDPYRGNRTVVLLNGKQIGLFANAAYTSILVRGFGDNDNLDVNAVITKPSALFGDSGNDDLFGGGGHDTLRGGSGNDRLFGGKGRDILLGETDNDKLYGGAGRDLLIGGVGGDKLQGDAGDDILIDGTTNYDFDDAALTTILSEWSSGLPYATRVANLRGGGGLNLAYGVDVFSDGSVDSLKGNGDKDWFLFAVGQDTTDKTKSELFN